MSRVGELETFIQVVDEGSFSAAARNLGVSKSHVSKTISKLEERLGARLLNRTTRKLNLTDVGHAFLERGRAIMAELDEAERAVTALQTEPRGLLRVSAPLSFGLRHLIPVVSDFMVHHPELRVELALDDRRVDLMDEGFDLAVRIAAQLDDSSFIAKRLGRAQPYLLASPAYLAAHGTPKHPQDLAEHRCLRYAYLRSGPTWVLTDDQGRREAVRADGPLEVNSGDAILQAAEAGLGVGLLPDFICCDAVRAGRLVRLLPGWSLSEAGVWALYPHNRHLSAKVRLFIEHMVEAFGGDPWAVG
ncbi:MAG: LysR family transcriptional regulator [Myxococcales bacterium]|nr:LysR family transcriptional regulator [Myxococcales bacterium]MCB9526604.1 LysR family transcriptional regulator [Myxococcales bacterium]